MLRASYIPHGLVFKRPAGTSRGQLVTKDSWYLIIRQEGYNSPAGIGECSIIPALSPDDPKNIEAELQTLCRDINHHAHWVARQGSRFPAIRFALETALNDLVLGGKRLFYQDDFNLGKKGIPINGLIWMGEPDFMKQQIREKLDAGFTCIKIKIGAIDFGEELALLKMIRREYSPETIEIRVDANGAFSPGEVLEKLNRLSEFLLHSIEQPIRQGQPEAMASLCASSPLPIALDEELIGISDPETRKRLLEAIRPQYIILKPSLLGGLKATAEWAALADALNIGWWVTSALESNIGLNAIAQWTYQNANDMPQGLGTGQLYTNNIPSPLTIERGQLFHHPQLGWDLKLFEDEGTFA